MERSLGHGLDGLFNPKSIAIIGASSDPTKTGGRPIKLLKQHGFQGQIYPVNPRADIVQELPAYPSVAELPGVPDLALVVVSGQAAVDAVRACAQRGVKVAVVLASGFGEADAAGQAMQAEITAVAKSTGMRVLGPNCLGAVSVPERAIATFSVALEAAFPPAGRVAVVSQSGNIGSVIMKMLTQAQVGISRFVATGNECDVGVADALSWMSQDDASDAVLCCVESVRDGAAWLEAVKQLRAAGKRVYVLKIGTSQAGQAAAMTHTGGLVGSDAVFDAAAAAAGAARVHSLEALVQLGVANQALQHELDVNDKSVVVVAASGGFGIMMADAASEQGFSLRQPSQQAQARIKASLPLASAANPVDATAQMSATPQALYELLAALLSDRANQVVCVMVALAMEVPRLRGIYLDTFKRLKQEFPERPLVACVSGPVDAVNELTSYGVICFPTIAATFQGLDALFEASRELVSGEAEAGCAEAALPASVFGHEQEAKRCLCDAGVPVLSEWCALTAQEAGRIAEQCGTAMAMKILSPQILHKTEVGGVALGVVPEDASQVFQDMTARVQAAAPGAVIEGVLMSPMVSGGQELIVGSTTDPAFGPVVMVGLGGIYAEVFRDRALRLAPVTQQDAAEMLQELKCFPLLDGYRGQARLDTQAAAEAIAAVSRFAVQNQASVASIDVNPLLVMEKGVCALDALLTPHVQAEAAAGNGEKA